MKKKVEGRIASDISEDGKRGVMVEFQCETDFAAKTDVMDKAAKKAATCINEDGFDKGWIDMLVHNLKIELKEDVRFIRYEVFDMRD